MPKKVVFTLFFVVIALVSCDDTRVFDAYKSVSNARWNKDKKITFPFVMKDTLSAYNLFINIRNNKNYPYSNLFLITELQFPNGQKVIDTLEYEMADAHGAFLGKGMTDIKENKLFYKEQKIFPTAGKYQLKISQAMRNNAEINGLPFLEGVTDVGFRIEKANKQ